MLENVKSKGDLVSSHRPTNDSVYIEGIVQRVYQDGDNNYYDVAWEDGKYFGEIFYEGELEEPDLEESEAILRVSLADFLTEDMLDEWIEDSNSKLKNLSPLEALSKLGLKRVLSIAIDDYEEALREEIGYSHSKAEDNSRESEDDYSDDLEDQLGDIFNTSSK